jgi:hypothetical protein
MYVCKNVLYVSMMCAYVRMCCIYDLQVGRRVAGLVADVTLVWEAACINT